MPRISFGVSLIDTVEQLSVDEYFSSRTYEEYSVAEIIGHLMYCKWYLLKSLATDFKEEYPFTVGLQGFHRSWSRDRHQKQQQIDFIQKIHPILMSEIDVMKEESYGKIITDWNMSAYESVHWICQHDIYHLSQIRNMGICTLAEENVMKKVNCD